MENKTLKVKVSEITEKTWQGKQFWEILTSEGQFTCWKPEMMTYITAVKNSKEEIGLEMTKTKKGNWAITSVEGVEAPRKSFGGGNIKAAMDRKDASIKGFVDRKENSITEAAIRRDAVIFTSVELSGKNPSEELLKSALDYWDEFFRARYN